MKKITQILVVVMALIFALGACAPKGGDNGGNSNETPPPAEIYNPDQGIDYSKPRTSLTSDGVSNYNILLGVDASVTEVNAAHELKKYIKLVSGATAPIIYEGSAATNDNYTISIGNTEYAEDYQAQDLNLDGFIIKSTTDGIVIKGERDRGTLYGVYDFVEKVMGVKFVTAQYEHIPEVSTIALYEYDIMETPQFMMRSYYYKHVVHDLTFASKMRMTAPRQTTMDDSVGGAFYSDWLSDLHSFDFVVPNEQYYDDYPEWFSAKGRDYQPRFSSGLNNDGTISHTEIINGVEKKTYMSQLLENLKEMLELRPNIKYVMLGQQDSDVVSTHRNCLEQVRIFGGRSGQIIAFVNAVSREITNWLKDKGDNRTLYFATFAYKWSFNAPVTTDANGQVVPISPLSVPDENVHVMFAPIEASYNETMNDTNSEVNSQEINKEISNWAKICDNFFMFDYSANFYDFLAWFPNTNVLLPNLKYYAQIGVNAVITEGSDTSENFYQQEMYCYIMSKLLWNINRDVNELIAEFNYYYAGASAGAVLDKFVSYMNTHFYDVASRGQKFLPAHLYSAKSPWLIAPETLNVKFILQAEALINEAYNALDHDESVPTANKPQLKKHILSVDVMVKFMKFKNYTVNFYTTEQEKINFYKTMFDELQQLGVTRLSEHVPIEEVKADLNI